MIFKNTVKQRGFQKNQLDCSQSSFVVCYESKVIQNCVFIVKRVKTSGRKKSLPAPCWQQVLIGVVNKMILVSETGPLTDSIFAYKAIRYILKFLKWQLHLFKLK